MLPPKKLNPWSSDIAFSAIGTDEKTIKAYPFIFNVFLALIS
jgi:hypothetical protein